jgi:hypothetical protein
MSGLEAPDTALEQRLDQAYQRVLKVAIALSLLGIPISGVLAGWRNSFGLGLGAGIALLNIVWLHQGAELLVRRMVAAGSAGPAAEGPSKMRMMLFFPLRYLSVIAAVYAILKGYPGVLVSFIVGLALPVAAMMGEGVYEAIVLQGDTRVSGE